ncbi:MAG: transporter, family, multidrug resistance protein [Solirubrobacteraceae bacterium]|nr:transporter, family, multidrug resistance protein [Solirubrobacteraceae bacterium]
MHRDEVHPAATLRLVVVLGCLAAFAPLAVDMYLPAWPDIQRTLDSSASAVQLTLTSFLLGIAGGQLVAGPLSDRFGRRTPLLLGVGGFVVASALCAVAPSIGYLVVFRFLQGFAGGAGIAVGRAVVRDLGSGEDAARNFSLLLLINNLGPIVAPVAGGQLLHVTDWRGIFLVLAAVAAVLLVLAWRTIPETLAFASRTTGGLGAMGAALREVGSDRAFLGYALSSGLTFSALLAYLAGSSFDLQDIYGLSPQEFSLFFALNGVGLVAVTHLNSRLVGRVRPRTLLLAGMAMCSAGALNLAVAVAAGGAPVGAVLPAFFLIVASVGLVQPNSTTLAMAPHPHVAGSASALLGVLQSAGGALVAPLVGVAGTDSAVPLAIIVVVLVTAAWVALALTRSAHSAPVEAPSTV